MGEEISVVLQRKLSSVLLPFKSNLAYELRDEDGEDDEGEVWWDKFSTNGKREPKVGKIEKEGRRGGFDVDGKSFVDRVPP